MHDETYTNTASERNQLSVLDLFSGIGGFSLGLERAGMRTVAFCEIDPYCRRVLAKHWPATPIYDDIRQLDGTQYAGAVDVVCGGYPCQPFSAAGKQQGEADPRHLWPEMRRVIRDARPRWVVAENVRGHVGLGFDTVAAQMEDDGFTVWPCLVPATAVGAPHRRERLWIVAHHSGDGWRARRQGRLDPGGEGKPEQTLSSGEHPGHLPDATVGSSQSNVAQPSQRSIPTSHDEGNRKQWAAEPDVGRVAHGVPARVDRLRALGNAVVPQIPELIGRAIVEYEHDHGLAA